MEDYFNSDFFQSFYSNMKTWVINELPGLLIIVVLFFIAFRIVKFLFRKLKKKLIHKAEKNSAIDSDESIKRINTLTSISHGTIRIILYVMFIMMILPKFGVNIAPVLASAGIIGLAIGFGAQELVRDYISGFFIILENQIRTSDVAIINGTGGLVESINLRTVVLRDFSGTVHIFQNGKISSLANMTKEWSAMVFDIGVAYKEDIQKVMHIMQQVGEELKNDEEFKDIIIEPIEVFGLNDFGDSALVIKARLKTKPIQQWTVGREYRKRLKVAFDKNNIEIPFPHRTVYWGNEIDSLKIKTENKS
ncbi:MAG: mechanosensitive ion channel family protein [Bacteroidales bacterium]